MVRPLVHNEDREDLLLLPIVCGVIVSMPNSDSERSAHIVDRPLHFVIGLNPRLNEVRVPDSLVCVKEGTLMNIMWLEVNVECPVGVVRSLRSTHQHGGCVGITTSNLAAAVLIVVPNQKALRQNLRRDKDPSRPHLDRWVAGGPLKILFVSISIFEFYIFEA
jgi:hypothetical protein